MKPNKSIKETLGCSNKERTMKEKYLEYFIGPDLKIIQLNVYRPMKDPKTNKFIKYR